MDQSVRRWNCSHTLQLGAGTKTDACRSDLCEVSEIKTYLGCEDSGCTLARRSTARLMVRRAHRFPSHRRVAGYSSSRRPVSTAIFFSRAISLFRWASFCRSSSCSWGVSAMPS